MLLEWSGVKKKKTLQKRSQGAKIQTQSPHTVSQTCWPWIQQAAVLTSENPFSPTSCWVFTSLAPKQEFTSFWETKSGFINPICVKWGLCTVFPPFSWAQPGRVIALLRLQTTQEQLAGRVRVHVVIRGYPEGDCALIVRRGPVDTILLDLPSTGSQRGRWSPLQQHQGAY